MIILKMEAAIKRWMARCKDALVLDITRGKILLVEAGSAYYLSSL